MSQQPTTKFRNILLCDDVRDEVGNKKSLMGVIPGDLLVGSFPATIQIASYFEYIADPRDGNRLTVEFCLLQDDNEVAQGKMEADISLARNVSFVLPRSLITFDKPATFKLCVTVNGGAEEEILNRKIMQAPTS